MSFLLRKLPDPYNKTISINSISLAYRKSPDIPFQKHPTNYTPLISSKTHGPSFKTTPHLRRSFCSIINASFHKETFKKRPFLFPTSLLDRWFLLWGVRLPFFSFTNPLQDWQSKADGNSSKMGPLLANTHTSKSNNSFFPPHSALSVKDFRWSIIHRYKFLPTTDSRLNNTTPTLSWG